MKKIVLIFLILVATAVQAVADGKMFWNEEIPPNIPYQRALILFEDKMQTLILQSQYEIPGGDGASRLGWVVPVPAVPEVASMSADAAWQLFWDLNRKTRPDVTWIAPIVFISLFFTVATLSFLTLLACVFSFFIPVPSWFKKHRKRLANYSVSGLVICFLCAIIVPSVASEKLLGVDVISEHRVGIYDVSIVRSDDAGDLIDWLNKHDFRFGENDIAAFDTYVTNGWCFVVAIINPSVGEARHRIAYDGLAAPLILRFPHPTPVYPVALTGTGGFETEILIYLASSTKMTSNNRLSLRYAGAIGVTYEGRLKRLLAAVEPTGFFAPDEMDFPYLCKFRDRLTPEEMSEDIVFIEAKDREPYRERLIKW